MNQIKVQQNAFVFCEDSRAFPSICDLKDPVVCPKPRRFGFPSHNSVRTLRWHMSYQAEVSDSEAGAELLDIILMKEELGAEQSATQVALSPPFFSGSPPSRVSNPLTQDARFGDEKPTPISVLPLPSPSNAPSSPSSTHKGGIGGVVGGCARMKFGLKPAPVRVEGFDCLNRDRQSSRIPAFA